MAYKGIHSTQNKAMKFFSKHKSNHCKKYMILHPRKDENQIHSGKMWDNLFAMKTMTQKGMVKGECRKGIHEVP